MTMLTLTMPRLGETMDEGIVTNWLVAPGQAFKRGDPLVEIETDKTLVEFPALGDGIMLEPLVTPDTKVVVGEPIARITPANAADWTESSLPEETVAEPGHVATVAEVALPRAAAPVFADREGPFRATPLARRLARNAGLDLRSVAGTGRRNRIERSDVEAAIAGGNSPKRSSGKPSDATILLIHGFAGDGRAWLRLASLLQRDGLTVHTPDLPGHGSSTVAASDMPSLVADMLGLTKSLSGELHIVGHSLGGAIAAHLAAELGDRVGSLTLLAPAGIGRDIATPFVEGMANLQTVGELELLLPYLGAHGGKLSATALSDMARELARGRLKGLASALAGPLGQRISIHRTLASLAEDIPVRVVFGIDDKVIPASQAMGLPANVAVHYIANAGHMPQWDDTEAVAKLIKRGVLQHD